MTATMLYSIFSHLEFFTVTSIVLNIVFLILLSLCFGGNWSQKLVACLINKCEPLGQADQMTQQTHLVIHCQTVLSIPKTLPGWYCIRSG